MLYKPGTNEKSDSDSSLERKYLRYVLICFYGSSLDEMAHKIRDEASKCMNQLLQSPSGYKLFVSWSTILDNLCLQSLPMLEAMKNDQGDDLFPGLRSRLIKNNDAYDAKELISIIQSIPNNKTDLGQVIAMMSNSWIGESLQAIFDTELRDHSFVVEGKPITVGDVMARVSWQCGIYPAWIKELCESKTFGRETKALLNDMETARVKHESSLTSLLLPHGLKSEAKRNHGKLVYTKTKVLLGHARLLEKIQSQCVVRLEVMWGKFAEERVKTQKVQRWSDQIETLGLSVQDLKSVLEHMKRKGDDGGDSDDDDVADTVRSRKAVKRSRRWI